MTQRFPRFPGFPGFQRFPGFQGFQRFPGFQGFQRFPGFQGFQRFPGFFLIVAMMSGVVPAAAQRNQPIYPVYDGFVKNPDGTLTLAFGYFSHNAEEVSIPPGADNSFAPDPGDRMQPTRFLPGHSRFQCVMVVGEDFDGKLVWNLAYADTRTGTSQNMLQSNWNLVEGARELRAIDTKAAARGVCLNRAPSVRVLGVTASRGGAPQLTISLAEKLNLFGSVADEGLPRGARLVVGWKQAGGPGTVTFENAAAARTRATFSAPGIYQLELSASDSLLEDSTRLTVAVTP
jgi:hypothetical protein